MYCEKCGNELNDNAVFCDKCGEFVMQKQQEEIPDIDNKKQGGSLKTIIVIIVLILIAVCISLAIGFGIMANGNANSNPLAVSANIGSGINTIALMPLLF